MRTAVGRKFGESCVCVCVRVGACVRVAMTVVMVVGARAAVWVGVYEGRAFVPHDSFVPALGGHPSSPEES